MPNKKPYIIPNDQRGHRPRLDPKQDTKMLGIPLPENLHNHAKNVMRINKIREFIKLDFEKSNNGQIAQI